MIPLVIATMASTVGVCTVEVRGHVHQTRCRYAADEGWTSAAPLGRRTIAPGMLDISLETITPGYVQMRNLTPGGLNSASGQLLAERNGVCWTGPDQRVCIGRRVPRRTRRHAAVPTAYQGRWGLDDVPDEYRIRIEITARGVTDDDGRRWTVSSVRDDDGVLRISGVADDDHASRGTWTVAIDPDGDLLLLGSPNSLPRLDAG